MVYGGMIAASENASYLESHLDTGLSVNTAVTGYIQGQHNIFHTNYWWFSAAALVEVVCIVLVAPTYWGWWRLGRPVSFSPLEMAKAFESPLLAHCNSNSSGRDIANAVSDARVQYGATTAYTVGDRTRLAFAPPGFVDQPQKGVRFDL